MAKSVWSKFQKEWERSKRLEQQSARDLVRAQAQARREHEQARREAQRQAATTEKEQRRLRTEQGRAEAAASTAECEARVEELSSLLHADSPTRGAPNFEALRKTFQPPPFDPKGLDLPHHEPDWADHVPTPPGVLGRFLGGRGAYEREWARASQEFDDLRNEYALRENERLRHLSELRRHHQQHVRRGEEEARAHNESINELRRGFHEADREAVITYFETVLHGMPVPEGFPHTFRLVHRREPRELVIDYELPTEEVVPTTQSFKYVQTRDAIDEKPRPAKEIKRLYADLLAQTALKVLRYAFSVQAPEVLDHIVLNGYVESADPATGRPSKLYLIAVSTARETFGSLVLSDLDPVTCVKQQLGARVSPHPGDHEPVRPMVDFEELLKQFKFVDGVDAPTDLDGRRDLLKLKAREFEHLVRQLFEAIGMQSWVTQASKDEGVDAVATNEDPILGGLCVIQAKRYSGAVGVGAVRELAGTMEDKHAARGILVTTSWVSPDGHKHAQRHGRMQTIEYDELIYLLKKHLEMEVVINHPQKPPQRR